MSICVCECVCSSENGTEAEGGRVYALTIFDFLTEFIFVFE